jgi:hypothetical protein
MSRFNINGIMGNQSDFNDFIGTLNIYDDNSASGIIYNRDGRHQNSKIVILGLAPDNSPDSLIYWVFQPPRNIHASRPRIFRVDQTGKDYNLSGMWYNLVPNSETLFPELTHAFEASTEVESLDTLSEVSLDRIQAITGESLTDAIKEQEKRELKGTLESYKIDIQLSFNGNIRNSYALLDVKRTHWSIWSEPEQRIRSKLEKMGWEKSPTISRGLGEKPLGNPPFVYTPRGNSILTGIQNQAQRHLHLYRFPGMVEVEKMIEICDEVNIGFNERIDDRPMELFSSVRPRSTVLP